MDIQILFFARLREAFGRDQESLQIAADSNVADVMRLLAGRGEIWAQELNGGRVVRAAINEEMAAPSTELKAGDVLALFPPVTGG